MKTIVQLEEEEYLKLLERANAKDTEVIERAEKYYEYMNSYEIEIKTEMTRGVFVSRISSRGGYRDFVPNEEERKRFHEVVMRETDLIMNSCTNEYKEKYYKMKERYRKIKYFGLFWLITSIFLILILFTL